MFISYLNDGSCHYMQLCGLIKKVWHLIYVVIDVAMSSPAQRLSGHIHEEAYSVVSLILVKFALEAFKSLKKQTFI